VGTNTSTAAVSAVAVLRAIRRRSQWMVLKRTISRRRPGRQTKQMRNTAIDHVGQVGGLDQRATRSCAPTSPSGP
jgi:hypothetical protein